MHREQRRVVGARARSRRRTGPRTRRPPSRPSGGGRSGGAGCARFARWTPTPPQQQGERSPAARPAGRTTSRTAGVAASGGTGTVGAVGQDGRGSGEHRDGRDARRQRRPPTDGVAGQRAGAGDGAHGLHSRPSGRCGPADGTRAHPRSSRHARRGRDGPRRTRPSGMIWASRRRLHGSVRPRTARRHCCPDRNARAGRHFEEPDVDAPPVADRVRPAHRRPADRPGDRDRARRVRAPRASRRSGCGTASSRSGTRPR